MVKRESGISKFLLKMAKTVIFCSFLSTILLSIFSQAAAIDPDIGEAASYNPPYTPTACNIRDPNQIPSGYLFGAVGEGLWNDGEACGKQYQVRCIGGGETFASSCRPGPINITIINFAEKLRSKPSKSNVTMALPTEAYKKIAADPYAPSIKIQFQQI